MARSVDELGAEEKRLLEARGGAGAWKRWGPYLSERQWGTVREDYSQDGSAWDYFPHDQARSRAYHWGEDGLAGLSDDKQLLCFSIALWNERDPILKERLFGLTNSEGNHGEDVKEYYFYLDSTPTHSYMKYLYKYPQAEFPYLDLVQTNRSRSRDALEYELLDTKVFDEDRYFDVFVEYAKLDPEEILIKVTVANRGEEEAPLHILPTLLFRNTWSWREGTAPPFMKEVPGSDEASVLEAMHPELGKCFLFCEGQPALLFTENETNRQRIFGTPNASPYVKDGINDFIVHGKQDTVNPAKAGTKAAAHYRMSVPAGQTRTLRFRLSRSSPEATKHPFMEFEGILEERSKEADEFYRSVVPSTVGKEAANIMRQALAGMLWTKQYFYFDADLWLNEHGIDPFKPVARPVRNRDWFHMVNGHIISMPDKWEYPWYAAWDLAFHTLPLSLVDLEFAKEQLDLMLRDIYLHPSGQIPAYEWNYSDVNPPVHAWATLFLSRTEEASRGTMDLPFLKRMFSKLLLNFTWWVNRKDRFGKNVFEGGFLGLDNIGVFDRSAPLPTGGYLEQADGTAWMSLYCQNMLELSLILASRDPSYKELAVKFAEHFFWIANAVNTVGQEGMWDEEDGFYYDLLRTPDGRATRLKVRSLVGLLPLCATTVMEKEQRESVPEVTNRLLRRLERMPELLGFMHPTGPAHLGVAERGIFALLNEGRLRRVLARMLDETEFLSPYGIRSVSRYHLEHPYIYYAGGREYRVDYQPAESNSGLFGGNSNWRGPVWMPINIMIIRALLQYYLYYGDAFKIECPTGSGKWMNLFEVSQELSSRLVSIFLRSDDGRRPVYGGTGKFQTDPHWRDHLQFYEYFHGDIGAGVGASHQTGWTGLVAKLIQLFAELDAKSILETGREAVFARKVA